MAPSGKQTRRRHRRRGSVYLIVVIVLMLIVALLGVSVFFQISEIDVTGNSIYSREEIIEASGIETGDSLIFIQKTSAAVGIKSLPYVDEVRIVNILPDLLRIEITEVYPLASVKVADSYWLFDKNAKLLEQTDANGASGTIKVSGIEPLQPVVGANLALGAEEEVRLSYLKSVLSEILAQNIQDDVSELDMSNIGNIRFGYKGRFNISLGTGDGADDKIQMLIKVVEELSETDKGTIDLSKIGEAHFKPD